MSAVAIPVRPTYEFVRSDFVGNSGRLSLTDFIINDSSTVVNIKSAFRPIFMRVWRASPHPRPHKHWLECMPYSGDFIWHTTPHPPRYPRADRSPRRLSRANHAGNHRDVTSLSFGLAASKCSRTPRRLPPAPAPL